MQLLVALAATLACLGPAGGFKVIEEDVAKILRFEPCDKRVNMVKVISKEIKALRGGVMAVDAVWEVLEDVGNITMQSLKLYKCRSHIEQESCELFTSFRHCETCNQLEETGQLWSSLVRSISPPFRCPIKKGRYVLANGTMDASALSRTPGMKGHYWEVKQKAFVGPGRTVFCYILGMELRRVRRRLK